MRFLKNSFNFYLDASIHVALAVVCLMGATSILLNIPMNFFLIGFTFFGTVVCYNFIKYGVEAKKYLIVSNIYHKNIQVFSFLCFAGALYFWFGLDKKIWTAILVLVLISMLYAIPFLPKAKNLRSLGGFKIVTVALVWTGFTVLLPILEAQLPFNWDFWVTAMQRFILVLILLLPFEIRDLQWDEKDLKTLPQVLGVRKTKKLGVLLTLLFFALTFLKDDIPQIEYTMRLILCVVLVLLFLSKRNFKAKYLASFWVEGIPIFWYGLFLVGNRLF
ncbi:hypothetical protein [Flagellimonas eckloniae]|uniref:Prenyltransferase n=1 Tax=Flagellimonas eckloniae TaxID=346185 RepID=A0A0Q1BKK9_9FLAO|nr:hypothetical protein [Allomuricauda eckloniae]KQC31199.1 hypothetical protein AAY42_15870 [Allomuricauda eckloniae]